MPELPQKTLSDSQDPMSQKRCRAALSPVSKSDYSLTHESPEIGVGDVWDPVLQKSLVVVSTSAFSGKRVNYIT